jgi:hypothetical protein
MWTKMMDFPGTSRPNPVSFVIDNKAYVGLGHDGTMGYPDFWEYDPGTNVWTRKADYPGDVQPYSIGFAINSNGYAGSGSTAGSDFFEYNPLTNFWTAKADLPEPLVYSVATLSYFSRGLCNTSTNQLLILGSHFFMPARYLKWGVCSPSMIALIFTRMAHWFSFLSILVRLNFL